MKEVVRTLKAFSEEKKRLEAELNQAYSNMDFASSKKFNQSQILSDLGSRLTKHIIGDKEETKNDGQIGSNKNLLSQRAYKTRSFSNTDFASEKS